MSLNPDTLVAISAYAGDLHQVENNLGLYGHHGTQMIVLSPEDAPIVRVSDPKVICLVAGRKCWAGPEALTRHILFMEILSRFQHRYFLFNDADSFCLSPKIPAYLYERDVIFSNEVLDTNPGTSMLPKIAMQPPYFFSRNCLAGMLRTKDKLPTSYYGEQKTPEGWPLPIPTHCPDHLMLQLAHGSGFAHENYRDGASFETNSSHGLNVMSDLVRNHGRVMLHSVKTKLALDQLVSDRYIFSQHHA